MRIARKLATAAAVGALLYAAIALGLIGSQSPDASPAAGSGPLDLSSALAVDLGDAPERLRYSARDGTMLAYRRYDSAMPSHTLLILVHGSAWHGLQWHGLARALSRDGLATVIAPDMRGHGADPPRRGDVDYIGQMEDDMADLIAHLRRNAQDARIVLGGHSSGGGFAVRFAGGPHGRMADAFVLLAPYLKYDAPTSRPNSGGWARPALRRLIGLAMLNAVGVRLFNDLPVVAFAMPRAVLDGPLGHTATVRYSYRLNAGFAPRDDYEADLAAIERPLLVLAGDADEAFHAARYEPVIAAQTRHGRYHVLPGVNHMGVVTGARARAILADWLAALPPRGGAR